MTGDRCCTRLLQRGTPAGSYLIPAQCPKVQTRNLCSWFVCMLMAVPACCSMQHNAAHSPARTFVTGCRAEGCSSFPSQLAPPLLPLASAPTLLSSTASALSSPAAALRAASPARQGSQGACHYTWSPCGWLCTPWLTQVMSGCTRCAAPVLHCALSPAKLSSCERPSPAAHLIPGLVWHGRAIEKSRLSPGPWRPVQHEGTAYLSCMHRTTCTVCQQTSAPLAAPCPEAAEVWGIRYGRVWSLIYVLLFCSCARLSTAAHLMNGVMWHSRASQS